MARKLRSMFRPIVPLAGSGERPDQVRAGPAPSVAGDRIEPGAVLESSSPVGSAEPKGGVPEHDRIAQLAYERWLETGDGEVQNWVWAEAELRRRAER